MIEKVKGGERCKLCFAADSLHFLGLFVPGGEERRHQGTHY